MSSYTADPHLNLYVFEESYVLAFGPVASGFEFVLDVAASRTNPDWHRPPRGEALTWWRGRLVFTECVDLVFEPSGALGARDANDEVDFGGIDTFELVGRGYHLEGEWGRLTMASGNARVVLVDPAHDA